MTPPAPRPAASEDDAMPAAPPPSGQPESGQPEPESAQPESERSESAQPESERSKSAQPESERVEAEGPRSAGSGPGNPGTDGSGPDGSGAGHTASSGDGRPVLGLTGRARTAALVLVALVVVSAVLVGWVGWRAYSTGREQAVRDEALAAARTTTAQVLSYGPASLGADLSRSRSMITGAFAAKFAQLADNVIVPAVTQQGLTTKATIVRFAPVDDQPDQVRALLFINQTSTSTGAPQPKTAQNQVRVTMTRVDGRWLISDLQPL